MGLFTFLLIVQTLVAASMIAVILMQRSEGGGLVSGGSPSGLMTARGATDFLTRSTSILATLFVVLSIAIAGIASGQRGPRTIDPSLAEPNAPASAPATAPAPTPAPAQKEGGVPLAQ